MKIRELILAITKRDLEGIKKIAGDEEVNLYEYDHLGKTVFEYAKDDREILEILETNLLRKLFKAWHEENIIKIAQQINIMPEHIFEDRYDIIRWIVKHADVGLLKDFIEYVPINGEDREGNTALIWAVRENHLELVRFLLRNPEIDLVHKNDENQTALSYAKKIGHPEIIKLLEAALEKTILTNCSISNELTDKAIGEGDISILLQDYKDDGKKELLEIFSRAVQQNNLTEIDLALSNFGISDKIIEEAQIYAMSNNYWDMALLFSAYLNHEWQVRLLSMNATEEAINIAIKYAKEKDYKEILDILEEEKQLLRNTSSDIERLF